MLSHISGGIVGSRNGSQDAVHTFPVLFSDASGVAKQLGTFQPIINPNDNVCFEPVVLEVQIICDTPDNAATSATLAVGFTPAAYGDFVAAYNMKTATAASVTLAAQAAIMYFTAPVTLFALPTRVGATTAGLFYVRVVVSGVNITQPTNQNS